ncbi:MAG: DUF11 domain-containing protein, partial [Allobaculum sp.]|nr:DUF11 domain-containing protein [Allobaculum sp.]
IPENRDLNIEYDPIIYYVKVTVAPESTDPPTGLEVKSIEYYLDEDLTELAPDNLALFKNTYIPDPDITIVKEQRKISPDGVASGWNKQGATNPMAVDSGDTIEYRITVTNTSDTTAKNVVITDQVPKSSPAGADLSLIEDSLEAIATVTGNTISWSIGDLSAGAERSVTFQTTVPDITTYTTWPNIASTTFGPDPENPTKKDSNEVVSKSDNPDDPDITIVKEQRKISGEVTSPYNKQGPSNPMLVNGGEVVEYKLTVSNPTSSTAQNVVLTDTIPTPEPSTSANFTLVEESIQGNNISLQGNTITWNLGDLAPNSTKSVTFKVNVPDVIDTTTWTNVATVTFGPPEDRKTKDSNEVTTKESPNDPNITIFKEQQRITNGTPSGFNTQDISNPMSVGAKDIIEYRVTVSNTSKVIAQNVVIEDTIPIPIQGTALLVLDETSLDSNVSINQTEKKLTWKVGDLDVGESKSVTFKVKVPQVSENTIWENIAYATFDSDPGKPSKPIPSNKVDSKEPNSSGGGGGGGSSSKPSISLVKEQRKISEGVASAWNKFDRNNPMAVSPGDIIEYQITVSNTSNTSAQNVVIKDTIPVPEGTDAQLVLDPASLIGQDVTINGTELTWKVGTLTRQGTSGASKSVTFKVTVPQVSGNTLWENVAHATFGPNPNNPTDSVDSNKVDSSTNPDMDLSLLKEQRKVIGTTAEPWNTHGRNDPMPVQANDIIEYRLTLTNKTMNSVPNVVIRDTLPSPLGSGAQLTLLDQSTTKGTVQVEGKTIIWTIGTLEPLEVVEVTFKIQVPNVEATTLWPNIATATYGEDPNNPTGQIPSNEVDIREPVESKTPTPTPPTITTTPGGTTNITNNNTNITNNSTINNPSSNRTSETASSKTPASNNGSNALTSTETNARFWAILFCVAILCLGVGICYSQRKRTH